MIKNFTLFALSCLLITLFISCTKDPTSSANPGGNAVYTMAGAPSTCTSPAVAGLYSAGLQLSGSNTITVSVNVVAKGSYALYTNNSNGVYFIGNGVFTTTGPQSVVLIGKGTPKAAGNYTFVLATTNTCSFSVTFNSGAAAASFTYAGAPGNCTAPIISGTYAVGTALGASNYVDLTVDVTTPGTYAVSTALVNGISFAGSGSFGSTGTKLLRLQGSGTPATATSSGFTPSGGGCGFSIAVVPPLPPAGFTYVSCGSAAINGTYTAGTALNASNTVVLNVNVMTPGAYSVSTGAAVNGVTFSASGSFAAAGPNTITLTSTNTPTIATTSTYSPAGGCSFDITYTGGGGGGGDFIKCKVNGTLTNFNAGILVLGDQASGQIAINGDNSDGGTDDIQINIIDMSSALSNGNYPNITAFSTNRGCIITYNSNAFNTSLFNANTFTVTVTTITATKAIGTFTGTVYDNSGTGPGFRNLTEGSFSVTY
jgi:hypothetical protein